MNVGGLPAAYECGRPTGRIRMWAAYRPHKIKLTTYLLPELSHKAVHFADHLMGIITKKEKKKNDFLSYTL
jgi:hypothetical protein